ncbi:MAG: hypothetical protein ABIH20_05045 [Candidatus Diapherotrites archaeon]
MAFFKKTCFFWIRTATKTTFLGQKTRNNEPKLKNKPTGLNTGKIQYFSIPMVLGNASEEMRKKLLEEELKLRQKQPEHWAKTKYRKYAKPFTEAEKEKIKENEKKRKASKSKTKKKN